MPRLLSSFTALGVSAVRRLWPDIMMEAASPMPRLLLVLLPWARAPFCRLWPGAMLGAVSPMLWVIRNAAAPDASAFLRLQLSAKLGAASPKPRQHLVLLPWVQAPFTGSGTTQGWALSPRCCVGRP